VSQNSCPELRDRDQRRRRLWTFDAWACVGCFRTITAMARQVTVQVVDDLDGAVLDEYETIKWSIDGKAYELDTSPKNAEKFRAVLTKYREASRRAGPPFAGAGATTVPARSKQDTHTIRDWANRNGFEVSGRGRVPIHVVDAYNAEQ